MGRRLDEVVQAEGLVARILETLQTGVAQQDVFFDLQLAFRRESRPARITMTGIRIAEDEVVLVKGRAEPAEDRR